MYLADYHLHSYYSGDSQAPMEAIIQSAVQKGLCEICFTDHMDLAFPEKYDIVFEFDLPKYMEELKALQNKYEGLLKIRSGIELGLQPFLSEKLDSLLKGTPFDFVIGSVHLVNGLDPYYDEFWSEKSEYEGCLEYFQTILNNLSAFKNFDSLGHIDYIVRYGPSKGQNYSFEAFGEIIEEILNFLIKNDIALEINSAGLKYGLDFPHPKPEIIKRYFELGGRLITLGSDAHKPEHVAYSFSKLADILYNIGFREYYIFRNRIPVAKPLS